MGVWAWSHRPPVNHDCTWRRPGMCSGASTAAPPNYKRVVQFSLSAVSKARFLIFLTPEADTKHKPTLRNIADEQTPGFISLMIRAGGRRAVVNTSWTPWVSTQCGEFLHWLRNYRLLQEDSTLCGVAHIRSCPTHGCFAWHRQPLRAVGGHWEGPTVVPGCSSIQPIKPTLLASMYRSCLLLRT